MLRLTTTIKENNPPDQIMYVQSKSIQLLTNHFASKYCRFNLE